MVTGPLLQLSGIGKAFPGVQALDNLSFALNRGEVHSLCGENGAGKSTIIKILAGVHAPDAGQVLIEGKAVIIDHPRTARNLGISTIYQENSLFQNLSVAENIFVGQEIRKGGIFCDRGAMLKKVDELLGIFELRATAKTPVHKLGSAEQKIIEILRALIMEARILILDEPTAAFGKEETRRLFAVIGKLKRDGLGVIYISHHLEEVFEISDRITCLRDGRVISSYQAREVDEKRVIRDMVGRDASLFYKREAVATGEIVFAAENLSGNGVQDISFHLKKGEILGIAGIAGAGRTELTELLFGAKPRQKGTIRKDGVERCFHNPKDAINHGMCLITEERKLTGLFLHQDITENTAIAKLSKDKKKLVAPATLKKEARRFVAQFKIKTTGVGKLLGTLSGGNQQKVILAKWFNTDPDIYLFDEPTRGIDIGAREDIYAMMVDLLKAGKSIIMVSSDLPELTALSDRILVMKKGRVSGQLAKGEISETSVMELAL
jgi:ribose transport system ATP-binding protein